MPEPAATSSDPVPPFETAAAAQPPEQPIIPPETASGEGGSPPPYIGFRPVLAGALAGGLIAAVMLLIAWGVTGPSDKDTALHRQAVRIGDLEASVRELSARKPTPEVDPKAVDALTQRLAKVEAAAQVPQSAGPGASDPALATRLAALEKTIAGLKDDLTALGQRSDQTAAAVAAVRQSADKAATTAETVQSDRDQGNATVRQDLESLSTRLTALERSTQAMRTDVSQQLANLAKDRSEPNERVLRLAVVAETLKLAVARGESFRTELDAAKRLAPNPARLAPLDEFSGSGVPSSASLGHELSALLPTMRELAAPAANDDQGFLKKLQLNAERLVRIRPVGEQSGDDTDSILARLEARAAHGTIGGALAELDKLPPAVRAPAASWIKKAHARDAALDASARFAAAAIGALAQPVE
jgi:hypothetical protein